MQELLPLPFASCFYICAGMFLCGCVAGVFIGMRVQGDAEIVRLLTGAADVFRTGSCTADFLSCFRELVLFFLPLCFCAFCIPGVAAVPVFSALRGLSFSLTCCLAVRVYGGGLLTPFILTGPGTFLSLPLFIVAAAVSLSYSAALAASVFSRRHDMRRVVYSPYFFFIFCSAGICALFALLDQLLAPLLTAQLLAAA